jgi:signal transduction histidine kinase
MLVREWRGARQLLRQVVARHPLLADGTLAALALSSIGWSVKDHLAEHPALLPLQLAMAIPLVWRRWAPLTVFGVIAAAAFAQWVSGYYPTPADTALLVALYTVAAYRTWTRALLAGGVLELGIMLACLRWAPRDQLLHGFVSLNAMALVALIAGINIRTRRASLASLENRAVRLERERDQQARLAVAGERARIAREMHDIVTHNLSVMVALADGAVFAQQRDPDMATAAMQQIAGTGRQALTDMRRFLGLLRDDEPDAMRHPVPGIGELEALVEQVRAAGLSVRLEVTGDVATIPVAAEVTVYRLVQEALTNTLKHTPPGTSAAVRVQCAADVVAVTVTDDGPASPGQVPAGHGVHGMRERAAAYGGELDIGPAGPLGGWRVAARLNLAEART